MTAFLVCFSVQLFYSPEFMGKFSNCRRVSTYRHCNENYLNSQLEKKTGISQGARQTWKRKQANGARENAGAMPRLVLGLYLIGCISGWHESNLDQSKSQSNFYRFRYWMQMILTNFKLAQNTLKFPILVLKVKEGYSLIGHKSDRICLPKEISPNKSTDISFRSSQGRLKPVKSLCFLWRIFLLLIFRLFLKYLLKLLNDYVDS